MRNARDFVSKMKLVISELDDNLIDIITKRINELKNKAEI